MSDKKKSWDKVNDFLKQDLYLLIFSLLSLSTIGGYIYATHLHSNPPTYANVLGTENIRGMWIGRLGATRECPDDIGVEYDRCVFNKYWNSWESLDTKGVSVDDEIDIENTKISVSFEKIGGSSNWEGVLAGNTVLDINGVEYRYQNTVFDSNEKKPTLHIIDQENRFVILVVLQEDFVGRSNRLSGYVLEKGSNSLKSILFNDRYDFVDITGISLLKDFEGNEYLLTSDSNPSYLGSVLYTFYNLEFELLERVLVVDEY